MIVYNTRDHLTEAKCVVNNPAASGTSTEANRNSAFKAHVWASVPTQCHINDNVSFSVGVEGFRVWPYCSSLDFVLEISGLYLQ